MRPPLVPRALPVLRAALLAGPVVIAFFAGGFGDDARTTGLIVAWALVAAVAVVAPEPLPRGREARLALGGLAALTAWVVVSRSWAPLEDRAHDDAARLALYLGAVLAGTALWRDRAAARWVEPLTALGIVVVTGYGLAGRLLPGLVPQTASVSAGGRFEQPLTYWNASGALAAVGLVLAVRLMGDRDRPASIRVAAAAVAAPLGTATYLSYSRGALAALAAGLVVLLVLAPTWAQARALAVGVVAAALGAGAGASSDAVRTLAGDAAQRERSGLIVLAILVVVGAAAAALTRRAQTAQGATRPGERAQTAQGATRPGERAQTAQGATRPDALPLPRRAGLIAAGAVVLALAVFVVAARNEGSSTPTFGATNSRLVSAGSNRYDYWQVALRAFGDHPLRGVGSGGFAATWLAERDIPERVRDAHSLELETLAELGLVGFAALAALLAGVGLAARRVQHEDPALAAGPAAALVVALVHGAVDWDWELPGLTLVALGLAAMLLAQADALRGSGRTDPAP